MMLFLSAFCSFMLLIAIDKKNIFSSYNIFLIIITILPLIVFEVIILIFMNRSIARKNTIKDETINKEPLQGLEKNLENIFNQLSLIDCIDESIIAIDKYKENNISLFYNCLNELTEAALNFKNKKISFKNIIENNFNSLELISNKLITAINSCEKIILEKINVLLYILWNFDENEIYYVATKFNKKSNVEQKIVIIDEYKGYIIKTINLISIFNLKIDELQLEISQLVLNNDLKNNKNQLIESLNNIILNINLYQ